MPMVQKYEFLPLLFYDVCCLQSKSFYFRAVSRTMKRYSLTRHRPSTKQTLKPWRQVSGEIE